MRKSDIDVNVNISEQAYKNWIININADHIAHWKLDCANCGVNTLNTTVMTELETLITQAEKSPELKGIIISSAKSSGFIAGADIQEFIAFKSEADAFNAIRRGQLIFNRLAALSIPTVSIIKNFCMGGGTELALACKYRVLSDDLKTSMGLPEVKLGIQPGWGGTIRLVHLIGPLKALPMIISGTPVKSREALRLGLADIIVPERHLETAAKNLIINNPSRHNAGIATKIFNFKFIRMLATRLFRYKLKQKISEIHYPAPYRVIDLWEKDGAISSQAMENEAQSIANLMVSETAQNLIRVFFLQEKLKSLGKQTQFQAKHVHIIGAGVMGGDIAAWCAFTGIKTTLQDREAKFIASAIKRAYELFKYKHKKNTRLIQQAMDLLISDREGTGITQADIIIEAIIENVAAKQEIWRIIELTAKPNAVLATNTSSIPLQTISSVMNNPARLIGIHFFNPAAKMPLVEIIRNTQTDLLLIQHAAAFVRQIEKLPLLVKSTPGFLINRILMPYLMEAILMLTEGFSAENIDKAAVDFGMPMGPIELADTVGLDVCLSVGQYIQTGQDNQSIINYLQQKIEQKKLGRKTGEGFYCYKNNKCQKNTHSKIPTVIINNDITDRLIYRILNESMACYREGIAESKDFIDAGMIFGTGFAPFRGGPLQYAEKLGHAHVISTLQKLIEKYGQRFLPDSGWTI